MNYSRILLAGLAATVVYFAIGACPSRCCRNLPTNSESIPLCIERKKG